ncbi:RNA pseudouridylate synthase domain-containing protein [Ditylenchus destructor]|uniref:RNA pseudouridylate synthase domain-containing protein n=1 Tax=Ditylenchus destructor TaxID=166010 RepID=A0AAD4NDH2_9BILA|nr:RNA pseudouridylate synthase domain-containing protein [Ditylenchus destructor]
MTPTGTEMEFCFDGFLDTFEGYDVLCKQGSSNDKVQMTHQERKLEKFNRIKEKRKRNRNKERRRGKANQKMAESVEKIQYQNLNLQIYLDLSFGRLMSEKEQRKLVRQIGRIWNLQKKYEFVSTTIFSSPEDSILDLCEKLLAGFSMYGLHIVQSDEGIDQHIDDDKRIVYLSPDRHLPPLLDISADCVYVIGGLVDETGCGSRSNEKAMKHGFECRRFPIEEFMARGEKGTFNTTLPINHMAHSDNDFFGIDYVERHAVPEYIRPKYESRKDDTSLKKVKPRSPKVRGSESKTSNYFDEVFFPQITEKDLSETSNKTAEYDQIEESNFFEKHIIGERHSDVQRNPVDINTVTEPKSFDLKTVDENTPRGEKDIWAQVDPVWKFTHEELVEYMSRRVIYQTDDVIAFDKPSQMAYACSTKDQAQMDRILQDLKKIVCPKLLRLSIVSSLDKNCSGVIIFAKSREKQEHLKELIANGHALYRYRCLVKGDLERDKIRVAIPLIKVLDRDRNMKLCPLTGKAWKNAQLHHMNTDIKLVNENRGAHVSLVDAFVKQPIHHVVRSHLYYGINCPIIGEKKYIREDPFGESRFHTQSFRLSDVAVNQLNISKTTPRRLPLYFHLAEVHLPESTGGKFSIIKADLPAYFKFTLKKLNLLKK